MTEPIVTNHQLEALLPVDCQAFPRYLAVATHNVDFMLNPPSGAEVAKSPGATTGEQPLLISFALRSPWTIKFSRGIEAHRRRSADSDDH